MGHPRSASALIWAIVGLLALVSAGSGIRYGTAAENQSPLSRNDLIAIMERGPGPAKGPVDAAVVMVEFSDFRCGYCRLFARETLPKIEERYIRTGKVRFVYRHMALQGEGAILAAQASVCAHDQGKFWEYHDALFGKKSPLAFTSSQLKGYAAGLQLEEKSFATCLDSGKPAEQVRAETMIGHALGARGTPAFLLNGQLVIGAYPFDAFQQALEVLLAGTPRGASGRAK